MENRNQVAVIPLDQVERMAVAFAKSGLFGIKTPEQGVALMLIAQAEGLHPAVAARDYHVIQGRPALKADAMLARFQQAGGKVVWNAYADDKVSGTFSHPAGGSATVEWTIQQAKSAGLTNKDVWRQYPRAMLRARVISEGIRTIYPGVSVGVYTPEEIEDFDQKPPVREFKAEVQGYSVEPVVETLVKAAVPAPKKVNVDPERKGLFDRLAKSQWAKDQLAKYAESVWSVKSAAELSTEHLRVMVAVVEAASYDQAMAEQAALAQDALAQEDFAL